MKRHMSWLAGVSLIALIGGGCALFPGGTSAPPDTLKISKTPATITVWSFFTDPELGKFNAVLANFHKAYPWITVNSVGGKANTDILKAINSQTPPDVALEAGPDDSAKYCSTGAWIDLRNYLRQENFDLSATSPDAAVRYTSYKGNQCSLPMLSDAYGFYYNVDMFKAAGIASVPKTYSQLAADAKKLTQLNSDGSIKVAGFVPLQEFYETAQLDNGVWSGARWYDSSGKSALGSDSRWVKLLQWQKSLIDWYGYDKLQKFFADVGGANSEFSSSNAFETGRVAMLLDGEWRPSFIKSDGVSINYKTAPFPVADDHPELYGAGQIGGTMIGIPKGAAQPVDAWLLVKYLALSTQAEEKLGEALLNVPTTFASLQDAKLRNDPYFGVFLKIFRDPHSAYKQVTPLGTGDVSLQTAFITSFEAGQVSDLRSGLQQLATQIDQQLQI